VTIRLYRTEAALRVEVANNGQALTAADQARIQALLAEEREGTDLGGAHLGIRNVHQRLRLIYAGEAALTLRTDERGDTLARISIPIPPIEQKQ
jgi:sensor histidine kinase YesM